MRAAATVLFLICALFSSMARAAAADGSFDVGSWHGSPVSANGSFAFCSMFGLFGEKAAPLALAIALTEGHGWTLAISSQRLKLPMGRIKARLAFGDEPPADIQGEIKSPTMIAFSFPTTDLLDRHSDAVKLVLMFHDLVLPFDLPHFAVALGTLRECLSSHATAAAMPQPLAEIPILALAPPLALTTFVEPSKARESPSPLFHLVGLIVIGFVASVPTLLLAATLFFAMQEARMRSRYLNLWRVAYHGRCLPGSHLRQSL